MKFSFEWLKSILKFNFSPQEIGEILTMNLAETEVKKNNGRWILDIDLLPDRIGDAASHLGISQEIATLTGRKFSYQLPVNSKIKKTEGREKTEDYLSVEIKSKNCHRYLSRVIFGVKVKESPKWLKERLIDCGLRPINNLVDASNYVMLLTGQPLHIFDFDKLDKDFSKKKIIIRQAKNNEKIHLLDDKEYALNEEITLIADRDDPLAVAGIKGGKKAEVDDKTTRIILESANFQGTAIRKASRLLSLKTDASYRFEYNLDPELASFSLEILSAMIIELSGGKILKGKIDAWSEKPEKKLPLLIEWFKIEKFLGIPVKKQEVIKTLTNLGFKILKTTHQYLLVFPPLLRNFTFQEEVIGEIGRVKGFNNLPALPLKQEILVPQKNENWEFKFQLREWLKGLSLEEVYNYSFISKKEGFLWLDKQKTLISLENPVSDNFYYLRPSSLFNFLKNVKDNFRFEETIRLFEIGKIYYWDNGKPQEKEVFSLVLAKKGKIKNGKDESKELFYEIKGVVESLLEKFGINKEDYSLKALNDWRGEDLLENGIELIKKNEFSIGFLGVIKRKILKFYDLENDFVVFLEIELPSLLQLVREEKDFTPLPLYPATVRDISFYIDKNVLIDEILSLIQKSGANFLEDVDLFDIYEPEGEEKSLSFHLVFRSPEKTLTSEEVDQEMKKIYAVLKNIGAKLR